MVTLKMHLSITKTEEEKKIPLHLMPEIFRDSGSIYKMYIPSPLLQYATTECMKCVWTNVLFAFKDTAG